VLIVEDNDLIAADIEEMLRELGFTSVAAVGNCDQAAAYIARAVPDLAILNIGLAGETSIPIARLLQVAGIPFLFASGYGEVNPLSDDLRAYPLIAKPFTKDALRSAVSIALSLGGRGGN
jgi:two-component SAPR family response regulator